MSASCLSVSCHRFILIIVNLSWPVPTKIIDCYVNFQKYLQEIIAIIRLCCHKHLYDLDPYQDQWNIDPQADMCANCKVINRLQNVPLTRKELISK